MPSRSQKKNDQENGEYAVTQVSVEYKKNIQRRVVISIQIKKACCFGCKKKERKSNRKKQKKAEQEKPVSQDYVSNVFHDQRYSN